MSQFVSVTLLAVLAIALVLATLMSREALEERASATAATDLRLAVLTVAPVESTASMDERERELFEQAVAALEGDHSEALHGLDPVDRDDVKLALEKTEEHGQMLLAGKSMATMDHGLAAHAGLEESLRQAAVDANSDASGSERRSLITIAVAGAAAITSASRMFANRSRRQSERVNGEVLRLAAERFSTLLDDSPEATAIISAEGEIIYQAASLNEMFPGHPLDTRASIVELAIPADRQRLAHHLSLDAEHRSSISFQSLVSNGSLPREFSVRVSDLRDDSLVGGWLVTLREITTEAHATRELESLVETDSLTGLPNRRGLMNHLGQMSATPFGFLMIDLDGFKQTNDTFGHDAGDELLKAVSGRFERCLDKGDRLYRLGGDEFGIVTQLTDDNQIEQLASTLIATLEAPIRLHAGFEQAHISIGIAVWNLVGSPRSVLHRADIALYEAKAGGGHRVQVIDAALEQRSARRRDLSRALDEADLDQEFSVVYQPIVDAQNGHTKYLEALLRWNSPTLGFIGPDLFIPLAESSGQIVQIGLWVLEHACSDLASMRDQGLPAHVGLTVNVSPRQLDDADFSMAVERVLNRYQLAPSDLTIEVTESALVSGSDQDLHPLQQLRTLGCHVACDDFGSGYSNLGQLMALPLDLIKVDRQLLIHLSEMRELAGGANDQPCEVMSAIVRIGGAMSAPIVAEGVETDEQRRSLASSGVTLLQGYLFSRPASPDEILAYVAKDSLVKELA